MLDMHRKKWRSQGPRLEGPDSRTSNGPVNLHAQEMAADAEEAMGVAASGDVQFCQYSANIICLDEDLDRLYESTRLVMKTIQNLGFSCRVETVNAVEAWRGSLPGDGYCNVRRVLLHTLNLADMLPITSVWAGLRENPSALMPKHSPPLLFAATSGATPFRFNLHVSDLGHTLDRRAVRRREIHGAGIDCRSMVPLSPRAGLRFRSRLFDLDADARPPAGSFTIWLARKPDLAFCPLRDIDDEADVAWAVGWIEVLCELNGLKCHAAASERLAEAVWRLQPLADSHADGTFGATCRTEQIRDGATALHDCRPARLAARC